jgi:hypothetical protein
MAESARIEELRRRVQLDPASIAFAALAEEYRRAGKFEAAVATCEAGLQRHPAYVSARVTLGRALLEMGRFEEARDELEHVLRVAPENLSAIRGLAEIHHRVGVKRDPDEAEPAESTEPIESPPPVPVPVEAPEPIRLSSLAPPTTPPPLPIVEDLPRADEAAPAPAPAPAAVIVQAAPSAPVSAPPPAPKTPPAPAAPIVGAKSSAPLMAPPPRAPAAPIARAPSPAPGTIVPPARPPNPDQAALPALEGLLAAVRRARAALPGPEASSGPASDR